MLFLLAVLWATYYGGLGPGVLAFFLGGGLGHFFFIPPYYSLPVSKAAAAILIPYTIDGAITIGLVEMMRRSRFRAERLAQALGVAEVRFRGVYTQAAVGIKQIDLATGRLLDANPAFCKMLGYTREELTQRTFSELTHPDDLPQEQALWERLLARQIPHYEIEKRHLRKDRGIVWVRVSCSLAEWGGSEPFSIAVVEDISNEKKTRDSLMRSEQVFHLAIENARDFAIITMDLEGRINTWNPGAERMFGWSEAEAIGRPADMLFSAPDRTEGIARWEMERARQEGCASDERWHQHKTGRLFYLLGSVYPLHDEAGNLRGFAKLGTDLTGRKQLEEELQQARKDLEKTVAERTARLTQAVQELQAFSYSLSHDLRAPLRAMQSYARILLSEYANTLPATGQEYLQRIAAASERLDNLIRDVLVYHQLTREDIQLHRVELEPLLEQLIHELPMLQAPQARIAIEHPLLPVRGHEPSLVQGLSNLLLNAVKFVPAGRQPQVRIRTEPADDQVRVWVEDNGVGIPQEAQARIWNLFVRLPPLAHASESTGIGLAIVRKAAERMGGSTGVESEPGHGSRFWIQLPGA